MNNAYIFVAREYRSTRSQVEGCTCRSLDGLVIPYGRCRIDEGQVPPEHRARELGVAAIDPGLQERNCLGDTCFISLDNE